MKQGATGWISDLPLRVRVLGIEDGVVWVSGGPNGAVVAFDVSNGEERARVQPKWFVESDSASARR